MAATAINPPVRTKTQGGFDAIIFEIDPDDSGDGINGRIDTPGMDQIHKSWNEGGTCRNANDDCNIDPHEPAVAEVIKRLRAARLGLADT